MYQKTSALVLSTMKYADNSLIVRCFTREYGGCSYLLKGILKPSKSPLKVGLFQPLAQLALVATYKEGALSYIKEAKVIHPYSTLHTHPYKSVVTIFLSEVCAQICQPDTPDIPLFDFLSEQLYHLDTTDYNPHFHLKFLLSLTRLLGFYPDTTHDHLPYFNIEEGVFTATESTPHHIAGHTLSLLKTLLHTPVGELNTLKSRHEDRNALLVQLLKYYQWHYPNFKEIKSLEVLQQVVGY